MKKLLFFVLIIGAGFVLAPHTFAENAQSGFVALAPIPGLTDPSATSVLKADSLANFFNQLYKYLIGLAAALAVIEIIWGGLEISTQDSISKNKDGKERIYAAITGLVLVLAPVVVFTIINPSILNLSLNLPPLDTRTSTPSTPTGTGTPTPDAGAVAATSAGCTITGTLLKTAVCPTAKDATDFAASCASGPGHATIFTLGHKATCGTDKGSITGPYAFADTSDSIFATLFGYSNYEPLISSSDNPNNGNAVTQFAATCTADNGTTCMSSIKLPCATKIIQIFASNAPSTSCWNISLSCTDGNSGAGGCDSNPKFTPVGIK